MAITKKAILFESKKKLEEAAIKLGPEDVKKLDEIVKLAKEIGLVTVADVIKFLENETEPGDTVYTALKCYRDMLGKDFKLKVEESFERLASVPNETIEEGCEKQTLVEDKFYLSRKDAEDDFTRLNHFLSVNGYSEIPYEVAGEIAVAAGSNVDAELISKGQLGYLGVDPDGYITVTAESSENLNKAREIAADFDCPIESEATVKTKAGKVTHVITINPFCGYEYGTPECEAAITKYTPDNQDVYAKRAAKRKAAAVAEDDFSEEDDDDFDGLENLAVELEEAKSSLAESAEGDDYDRRTLEQIYGLEDGELDGKSIREAEKLIGCEEGELDSYLFSEDDEESSLDEGGCKKAKCEECGKECEEDTLVEELSRGHICKECLLKHRLAGESVAYIRKKK